MVERSIEFSRPKAVERAEGQKPLAQLMDDAHQLIQTIMSEPAGAYRRLAIGLLAAKGGGLLDKLCSKASRMEEEAKESLFRSVAEEVSLRDYKRNKDLLFIARFGTQQTAERAVGELISRDGVFELLSLSSLATDDDIKALAMSGLEDSEKVVDIFLTAMRSCNKYLGTGNLQEFVSDRTFWRDEDAETKTCIGFVRKYLADRADEAWSDEFKSDISLLPLVVRIAATAHRCGRDEDAKEIIETLLGKKFILALAKQIEKEEKITTEMAMDIMKKREWGDRLLNVMKDWMNVKDELLVEEYAFLHSLLKDDLFLVESEIGFLLQMLPDSAKEKIALKAEEDLDILLSPFLTDAEKEKITGMTEEVARTSLNLGLIRIPMPRPFANAEEFERHTVLSLSAIRPLYDEEDFKSFAINRVLTAVMENTPYQKSTQNAGEVLRLLGEHKKRTEEGRYQAEIEVLNEAFRRMRAFIEYHKEEEEWRGVDFYQSIRIKAFMEHRRILVADDTGTGKTIVALGAKCAMDREMGKRSKVLVLATPTGTRSSWGQEKIDEYCDQFGFDRYRDEDGPHHPEPLKVFFIKDNRDLKDMEKFRQMVEEADLVVMGHGKLTLDPEANTYLEAIFEHDFDAVFIDEYHNMKNAKKTNTGKCAKEVIQKYKEKRMLLLTATPLPNSLDDGIGMLLYALDPDKHPEAEHYKYDNDPEKVSGLWMGQRWFKLRLEDIMDRSNVNEEIREVELSDDDVEAYFNLWKEFAFTGFKFNKLLRVMMDSEFAERRGGGRCAKLEALDKIVDEAVKKGRKVVVWTPLVEGVIDGLLERYESERYNAIKIDGRITDVDKRYEIAQVFKESEMLKVMVISGVADEAIDLSRGDEPVLLVRLMPPLTPRTEKQTQGRVNRRTQLGNVEIITLVAKSEKLSRRMLDFANDVLPELGLTTPRDFMAQTIDQDILKLLDWKKLITDKPFKAMKISDRDKGIWAAATPSSAEKHLVSSLSAALSDIDDFKKAIYLDQGFRRAGALKVAELMAGRGGKGYASLYEKGWKGSHSEHTLVLIREMIMERGLEGKKVIDLGGGAAYASRVLNHPTTVFELNEYFIEKGKEACAELGLDTTFMKRDMRDTGLEKATGNTGIDFAISSHSLHHLQQTETEREVEETILEMNRVMKKGGTFFIALPWSTGEETLVSLAKGLSRYGFAVTAESGVYKPVFQDKKHGEKILLLVARKEADCDALAPQDAWHEFTIFEKRFREGFAAGREKKRNRKNNGKKEKKKAVGFRKVRSIVV